MARWAVIFENETEHPALRDQSAKDAHHAYLRAHRGMVRAGGAIAKDQDMPFIGGMWMVEAPTRADVQALAENSPFYLSGVHKSYRLVWWGSAPGLEEAYADRT